MPATMTRPLSLPTPYRPAAPYRRTAETPARPSLHGSATRLLNADDRAAALAAWSALARQVDTRFFHSDAWLRSWLACLPAQTPLWLLQARRGPHCIGLAFVVKGPARRLFGLPFAPAWHLQATGSPLDAICIEHNDLLVDPAEAPAARRLLIQQWLQLGRGARELHLTNLGTPPSQQAWPEVLQPNAARLAARAYAKPSYSVDLQRVREHGHDLLALRSANLRSQVRRTLRAYAELGPLRLDTAHDPATALQWFGELADLHQRHWTAQGHAGAFANPALVDFHRRLIDDCGTDRGPDPSASTHVQLLRLSAGPHVLAYLYNLVHRGRVHFYQSGFDYTPGGKHARPGYAAHVLAVEHNARLGHQVYDFLMGETRYKRDLATDTQAMHTVVLQTPALRFSVEAVLRRLRQRARGAAAPVADAEG